mmetsp:Transcript_114327/g.262355  ORF Transcript_114327/g.262355 Transcript_114327/m.262355 type:complete len:306 (-) Transcript_114327:8-925(-)
MASANSGPAAPLLPPGPRAGLPRRFTTWWLVRNGIIPADSVNSVVAVRAAELSPWFWPCWKSSSVLLSMDGLTWALAPAVGALVFSCFVLVVTYLAAIAVWLAISSTICSVLVVSYILNCAMFQFMFTIVITGVHVDNTAMPIFVTAPLALLLLVAPPLLAYLCGLCVLQDATCGDVFPAVFRSQIRWFAGGVAVSHLGYCFSVVSLGYWRQRLTHRPGHGAPELLDGIPNAKAEETGNASECCICADVWGTATIKRTACNHFFHEACLGNWLKTAHLCPLCRRDLLVCHGEPPFLLAAEAVERP